MKFKVFCITMFLTLVTANAQVNKTYKGKNITPEDLYGRWVEVERYIGNSISINDSPFVYIFYDDMKFVRGEDLDSITVFGVSGDFIIEDDYVIMWYRNHLKKGPDSSRELTMYSKVLSITKDQIVVEVRESPQSSYKAVFRREY